MSTLDLDFTHGGYRFVATATSGGDSNVVITKDDLIVRSFRWPTYKIFNIPAHADDIVADLDRGLLIAGSDGLGGNVYSAKEPRP